MIRYYEYFQMLKKRFKDNQVKFPQLEWVKFRRSRNTPDRFELKQASLGYFVMLSMQLNANILKVLFYVYPLGLI